MSWTRFLEAILGPTEPNRRTVELLIGYLVDQYFISRPVTLEEMFAAIVTWNE
jgi:hypothetical protein